MEEIKTPDEKIQLLESIIADYFTSMEVNERTRVSTLIDEGFTQYGFQTLIMTNGHDELKTRLQMEEYESLVLISRDILFDYAFQYNRYFGCEFTMNELISPLLQARAAMLEIAVPEDISAGRYIEPNAISYIALIFIYIVETLSSEYIDGDANGKPTTNNGDA